jgi:hypothetical protein
MSGRLHDMMYGWLGFLTPQQQQEYIQGQQKQAPKEKWSAELLAKLRKIAERRRKPSEDPPLAIPTYVPDRLLLYGLRTRVLDFLLALGASHLEDRVVLGDDDIFVTFLDYRIYLIPNLGAGQPDFMFEVWFKGSEEWDKHGLFSTSWRAFEHIYTNWVRDCTTKLARRNKG